MLSPSTVSLLLALASVSRAAFLLDGPPSLTTCQEVTYSWDGGAFPMTLLLGDEERTFVANRATSWVVDYPAGSLLNVRIDSGTGGSPNYAYAGSMVVQAGTDTSCIPASHANATIPASPIVFTALPDQLTSCETASFSWSGGTAPYTVLALALNSAGAYQQINTTTGSLDWQVNFPGGSTVYLNIVGTNYLDNSAPTFSKTYYVYNGTSDACVGPTLVNSSISNPPARPIASVALSASARPTSTDLPTGNRSTVQSGLSVGAIVGIVVGVVSLFAIYAIYALIRRRQKRQDQRRQNALGMQKIESSATLEKVTVASGAAPQLYSAQQPYAPRISSRMAPDHKQKGRAP